MKQTPELTAFYNAYHDWLEAGAPAKNKYGFKRYLGLCSNIKDGMNSKYILEECEMKSQFEKAGLCEIYPFGEDAYNVGNMADAQHLDKNRIAWVKAHLTEEVDEKFTLI